MAIDFEAIENALLGWLVRSTGVQRSNVILDLEQLPALGMPYVALRIPEPQQVDGPDDLIVSDSIDQLPGEEITTTVVGQREFVATIKAFTFSRTGRGTAKELLSRAQTSIALPGTRDCFNAAGLAFVAIETFQDLSSREGPNGQGRAVMDVRFRTVDTACETGGYIATAHGAGTAAPG